MVIGANKLINRSRVFTGAVTIDSNWGREKERERGKRVNFAMETLLMKVKRSQASSRRNAITSLLLFLLTTIRSYENIHICSGHVLS